MSSKLLPRQPVPLLELRTLDGRDWALSEQKPERFTFLFFYRSGHCTWCKKYLQELNTLLPQFEARGTQVAAISVDDPQRSRATCDDLDLSYLTLLCNLSIDTAKAWGLYVSAGRRGPSHSGLPEPDFFTEPAAFLVRPDGSLYAAWLCSLPYARPPLTALLQALDSAIDRNYPARGEVG